MEENRPRIHKPGEARPAVPAAHTPAPGASPEQAAPVPAGRPRPGRPPVLPLLTALLLAACLACPRPAQALERIVGGNQTDVTTWPSTVALLSHGTADDITSQFCGGTLIASRWVLTAAHCTRGKTASQIDAVTGRSDMNTSTGQRIQVQAIHEHPSYSPGDEDSDLALLYLSGASTQPAMGLVSQNDPEGRTADGTQGITVGWGDTVSGSGAGSVVLRQVMVPIIPTATANAADWYNGAVTANMFAAGYAAGTKDSCQGDSGGPYMVPDGGSGWILAGAVSWGEGCADPKRPGIYTRLSKFRTWIDGKTGGGGGDSATVPALEDLGLAVLAGLLALAGLWTDGPASRKKA